MLKCKNYRYINQTKLKNCLVVRYVRTFGALRKSLRRYFSYKDFAYILEHLSKGTPLSDYFCSFQQSDFTREYIFPMKILLPGIFKCENTTFQNISRGAPMSKMSANLLVNKHYGSNYFPVNNYWRVLFSGEYFFTVTSVFFALLCLLLADKLLKSYYIKKTPLSSSLSLSKNPRLQCPRDVIFSLLPDQSHFTCFTKQVLNEMSTRVAAKLFKSY